VERASDWYAIERSWVPSHSRASLFSEFGQVIHTHVPPSPSIMTGTGLRAVISYGWEGVK